MKETLELILESGPNFMKTIGLILVTGFTLAVVIGASKGGKK